MRRLSDHLPALPSEVDVVVVGAGIQGLTTALVLARAGREVAVLERGDPFREASGVNAGSLAVQNKRLPLVPFARAALAQWRRDQEELGDLGFVPAGGLRVAESAEDVVRLRASAEEQSALGLPLEWLEGATLRERAPWLGDGVRAATYCPEDGFASPLLAGRLILEAVSKAGASVWPGAGVEAVAAEGARLQVRTARGPIRCGTLVIAAGVWTGEVARMLGVTLPVGLDTNMLTITESAGP